MENERIKDVRLYFDLTQSEFGAKLGVTAAAISRIEVGERAVTKQMRIAICREFNVDYEWLVTGQGKMRSTDFDAR